MPTSLMKAANKTGKGGKSAGRNRTLQQKTLTETFTQEQAKALTEKQHKKQEAAALKKKEQAVAKKAAETKTAEEKKKAEARKAVAAAKEREEAMKKAKAEKLVELQKGKDKESKGTDEVMEMETPMQDWKRDRETDTTMKAEESGTPKPPDGTKTPTSKKNWPNRSTPKLDPTLQDPTPMEGVEIISSPLKPECKDFPNDVSDPENEVEVTNDNTDKNGMENGMELEDPEELEESSEEESSEEEPLDEEGLSDHAKCAQRAIRKSVMEQCKKEKEAKRKAKEARKKEKEAGKMAKQLKQTKPPAETVDLISPGRETPAKPTQTTNDGNLDKTPPRKGSASKSKPPASYKEAAEKGESLPSVNDVLGAKEGGTHQYDHRHVVYGKFKVRIKGPQTWTSICEKIIKIAEAGVAVDKKFCFYGYDNNPNKAPPPLPKVSSKTDIPSDSHDIKQYFNGLKVTPDERKKKKQDDK